VLQQLHREMSPQESRRMPDVRIEHFERAAQDIGTRGDNDTLPFDVDNRFVKEKSAALSRLAYSFFEG
jgi:hypothetical protein